MKLPHTSLTLFFAFAFCIQNIAQNTNRNEDGTIQKETDYVSLLCGKEWKWNEGIVGNHPYESVVFSLEYDTNKTFRYNQRSEKNYWRINGNHIIHSIAPFGKKKKNPFGIFDGEYEITKITDSVLVLTKVDAKPGNPANVLRFVIIPKTDYSMASNPVSIYKPTSVVPVPADLRKPSFRIESNSTADEFSLLTEKYKSSPNGIYTESATLNNYMRIRTIIVSNNSVTICDKHEYFSGSTEYFYNGKQFSMKAYKAIIGEK